MSFNKFRKYLPFNDPDKLTLQIFLSLLILLAAYGISILLERKLNLSEKRYLGEPCDAQHFRDPGMHR